MLTITDMTGSIDSPFGALAFEYDSAAKQLKLKHMGPEEAMALLRSIDEGHVAEVPDEAPVVVATKVEAPVVQAEPRTASAPEKKKRVRKTKAQREAAKAAASEELPQTVTVPGTNGVSIHREGSASAPTEVSMEEDDEVDFRSPTDSGIVVEEVEDLSTLQDEDEDSEEDVPEGWVREMADGKMQVFHVACGATECLCHLSTGEDEEDEDGDGEEDLEQLARDNMAAATAPPVKKPGRSKNASRQTASSEAPDDPVFEALKKCERLVNVIPVMQEHGIEDAQELYDKCVALKEHVPCLAKISANFDERIKRAISVRVQ